MTYYTFRLISQTPDLMVECNKWGDRLNDLQGTYIVYPNQTACNCIATKRECKHVVLAKAIIKPEFIREMHRWVWKDNGESWQYVEDIPEVERVLESLSAS